jgi:nucleotide-binding universal stress UspA family protein
LRILVTLDGSKLSEAVLEPAQRLARATGAEVHLLIVGHPPRDLGRGKRKSPDITVKLPIIGSFPFDTPRPGYYPRTETVPIESREQFISRREHELEEYLMEKAHAFEGLEVKRATHLSDSPADFIVEYAREQAVDLIAMATHGRSGLSRLVQGSVAAQVVQSGVAPVLLARPLCADSG